MTPPGRRLAIDYGKKRIGLAVCDPLGIATRPLPVLQSTSVSADLDALAKVVADEEVAGLVLGIPLQLDGADGRAAQEVRLFANVLRERFQLPVDEIDERMTTKAAHALMKDAGQRHSQRKGRIDSTAALLILKTWLDKRRMTKAE